MVVILGLAFGLVGPILEFSIHRQVPYSDIVAEISSEIWGPLVIQTWPTVLLGLAGVGWLMAAVAINVAMFVGAALFIGLTRERWRVTGAALPITVIFPLLYAYCLGGSKHGKITLEALVIGIAFYATFCALAIAIRLKHSTVNNGGRVLPPK